MVDDHQLDRHFTQNDIKELYKFQIERLPEARPTSTLLTETNTTFDYPIPKDHLLLDLLYEHNRWIHSYHSHDSLLENKIDESLSADERRRGKYFFSSHLLFYIKFLSIIALEEYENLKRLPDQRQMALQRFQQQQRLNALIAQQQQQSASASAQATRPHQPNYQQLYSDIFQSLQAASGQNVDYVQVLQCMSDMGFGREITNKRVQQRPNMNQKTTSKSFFDIIHYVAEVLLFRNSSRSLG